MGALTRSEARAIRKLRSTEKPREMSCRRQHLSEDLKDGWISLDQERQSLHSKKREGWSKRRGDPSTVNRT